MHAASPGRIKPVSYTHLDVYKRQTHDQVEAMTMSDRVFVINRGVVQQVGSPIEIYRRPKNQFIADFVGKVNFIKGAVNGGVIDLKGLGQSLACLLYTSTSRS